MSIDARLERAEAEDLAHLRERGGSKTKELAHAGRGREAEHPGEIPARGWKDILWRACGRNL